MMRREFCTGLAKQVCREIETFFRICSLFSFTGNPISSNSAMKTESEIVNSSASVRSSESETDEALPDARATQITNASENHKSKPLSRAFAETNNSFASANAESYREAGFSSSSASPASPLTSENKASVSSGSNSSLLKLLTGSYELYRKGDDPVEVTKQQTKDYYDDEYYDYFEDNARMSKVANQSDAKPTLSHENLSQAASPPRLPTSSVASSARYLKTLQNARTAHKEQERLSEDYSDYYESYEDFFTVSPQTVAHVQSTTTTTRPVVTTQRISVTSPLGKGMICFL